MPRANFAHCTSGFQHQWILARVLLYKVATETVPDYRVAHRTNFRKPYYKDMKFYFRVYAYDREPRQFSRHDKILSSTTLFYYYCRAHMDETYLKCFILQYTNRVRKFQFPYRSANVQNVCTTVGKHFWRTITDLVWRKAVDFMSAPEATFNNTVRPVSRQRSESAPRRTGGVVGGLCQVSLALACERHFTQSL